MKAMAEDVENDGVVNEPQIERGVSFNYFLAGIARGDFHHELTQDLVTVAQALKSHVDEFRGEPTGEISIKLKFKLTNKGYTEITAEKTVKTPKRPAAGSLLYIDEQKGFVEEDPKQLTMGFARTGPRAVK